MKECVLVDGVRSANARAHAEKGWFKSLKPDEVLAKVYTGLFERNPKIKPEDIEAVFCGCANITGLQNDIGRLAWIANGFPESVATNTITQQCPSGMSAAEHAARAIIADEGDIFLVSGVEDMQKVPMAMNMDLPANMANRYNIMEIPMGPTAEKVAKKWNVSRIDQENMAFWSHKKAAEATKSGKFSAEIIPIEGEQEDGTKFMVDRDQWVRETVSMEKMATMNPAFSEDGTVTAATSSPLTAGAAAAIFMNRE